MAGAILIAPSSHFFGPESHLQAAEILLPGLFSVVHLSSQHIRQHSVLGLPWANGESLAPRRAESHLPLEGLGLVRVAGKGKGDGTCVLRHADRDGKGWGCQERRMGLPLMSPREQ